MKFCCERFQTYYHFPREYGPNIRVVKYSETELLDKNNLYRFYVSFGYQKGDKNVLNLNIAFCPFCGANLFELYKNDYYVNEEPGYF